MMESVERPFGELPAALVDEVLKRTEVLSQKLPDGFEQVRACRLICMARKPKCNAFPLFDHCSYFKNLFSGQGTT